MKRQINALLALVFIISTLTTSLHELLPHHHSSECQVCTLVKHNSALIPEHTVVHHLKAPVYEPILSLENQHVQHYKTTLGSRAPPLFS
ncbi:MAG: hypothetical protein ABFR02_09215 [Campylobacterota bacterium]